MNGQDICLEALLQLLNTGVKLIYNKLVSAFSRFLCHYQGAFSRTIEPLPPSLQSPCVVSSRATAPLLYLPYSLRAC